MRVLQVSAELFPLLKTGGLADVTGALPAALADAGADVRVLLPGFPAVLAALEDSSVLAELHGPDGTPARLRQGLVALAQRRFATAYVIDAPALYDRPGDPYQDADGQPYADNLRRFALLGWAAARLGLGADPTWRPEVVHAHDWHAGMAPAYLALEAPQARPATVFTIHNLAYQGLFAAQAYPALALPASAFDVNGLEFHGQVSFMKAGLYYADRLTTVSPSYAQEIQGPEQGCGLEGLLRARAGALTGILNGVDESVWNPATDRLIPHPFDARRPGGKALCKAALQQQLGLVQRPDAPLFTVVSRLTEQKGLQLVLQQLDTLRACGGQLALLGSGDAALVEAFNACAAASPDAIAVRIGYDETLAHRIVAAGDVSLVPSRFEPCGLTQLYGLKYGSLPLVHRVGGLADTVADCTLENLADGTASGFVFERFSTTDFERALRRAFALHARPADWRRVRASAMRRPAGWSVAAARYLTVYEESLS